MDEVTESVIERELWCPLCCEQIGAGSFTDAQVKALMAEHKKNEHKFDIGRR